MPQTTLVFAAILIVIGLTGYFGTPTATSETTSETTSEKSDALPSAESTSQMDAPKRSVTALIPAFTGGLLLVFGLAALKESWRKHAMHGAVLIGLLGCLAASGRGIPGLIKVMSGSSDVNSRGVFFVTAMALVCGIYVALCVRSFIAARRRRVEGEATG